jgi:hypothetical protein
MQGSEADTADPNKPNILEKVGSASPATDPDPGLRSADCQLCAALSRSCKGTRTSSMSTPALSTSARGLFEYERQAPHIGTGLQQSKRAAPDGARES